MALKVLNFRGYQIETIRFGNVINMGFKVHSRYYFPGYGKRNHEELGEFRYFMDAAKFIVERLPYNESQKQLAAIILCDIYAEGEDFTYSRD